jgi:hypothetical protein
VSQFDIAKHCGNKLSIRRCEAVSVTISSDFATKWAQQAIKVASSEAESCQEQRETDEEVHKVAKRAGSTQRQG